MTFNRKTRNDAKKVVINGVEREFRHPLVTNYILALHYEGCTVTEIHKLTGINWKHIRTVVDNGGVEGAVPKKPKAGNRLAQEARINNVEELAREALAKTLADNRSKRPHIRPEVINKPRGLSYGY